MKLFFTTLALGAATVSAAPAPAAKACNSGLPKVVGDILRILPEGTPFCSSYLSIPTISSTVSKTVATTTVYTSTTTSTSTHLAEVTVTATAPLTLTTTTGTNFVTNTATESITSTSVISTDSVLSIIITSTAPTPTSTVTATSTLTQSYFTKYPPPAGNTPRDLDERGISIPAPLIKFAKAEISFACSCLNIPTSTVTATVSVTQTASALATASADITSTVSVQVTSTETIYSSVADVKTFDATTTLIDVLTTTTTHVSSVTSTTVLTPSPVTQTTTSTATSVITITTDPCDPTTGALYYKSPVYQNDGILHFGYTEVISRTGDRSPAGCCRQCYNTPGCVIAFSIQNYECDLLLNNIKPVVGANAQCPAGYDVIDTFGGRLPGLPAVGVPVENQYPWTIGPCFSGNVVD